MTDYSTSAYQQQLEQKSQQTLEQFAEFSPPPLTVFASPAIGYRMRAEFKIWHHNNRADYAMFVPGTPKKTYIIEDFPPASSTINQLMAPLLNCINSSELLAKKLFQCEFLSTTRGECVITLIYHKTLDEAWQKTAAEVANGLGCHIIGRAKKQKLLVQQNWVHETLTVNQQEFHYEHVEASFTQPNAYICTQMLNWAFENSQHNGGDLLELYCGNGNFTLPLAQQFNKVLATEISKTSVDSAKRNMARNNITNIEFARLSSEEFTEALEGVRQFRRLENIDLNSYDFSTVLVDPPRAGLDGATVKLIQRFNNIIYISCNPDTLYDNLQTLSQSHNITAFALFDQFPFTHHRECGVILKAKP